jgi:hypothetical protein
MTEERKHDMKKTQKERTQTMVLTALFLALGLLLPSITGSIKEIGDSLLPLHLVVMLCGAICGWQYAAPIGLLLPFLRAAFFGMPPFYPNAVWMSLELVTYGFVIGFLFSLRKKYSRVYLLICLVCAMLAGRVVWGIAKAVLLGIADKPFGLEAFLVGGFVDAVPGIILQFVLVPLLVELAYRTQKKTKS